jgi:hypothetical protein
MAAALKKATEAIDRRQVDVPRFESFESFVVAEDLCPTNSST